MDAARALADLAALSPDVLRCAVLAPSGAVEGAFPARAGERLAGAATELLASAPQSPAPIASVEVAFGDGSAFVVREGSLIAVAVTRPEPPSALVLHDLRRCLRQLGSEGSRA